MCRRVCVWVMCKFVQMPAEAGGIVFPGADWVQVTASHLMWVLGMDSGPLEEQCTSFSYLLSYFSSPFDFSLVLCLFSGDTLFGCNFQHASISSKLHIFYLFFWCSSFPSLWIIIMGNGCSVYLVYQTQQEAPPLRASFLRQTTFHYGDETSRVG